MCRRLSSRLSATLLLALTLTIPFLRVHAMYMAPDVVNVPVERLIKNLEALAKSEPTNVEVWLNLARAHSMAYALKTDSAQVWRGREDKGVWFGYEPPHIPFAVKPTSDRDKLKTARAHLNAAIEVYEEVLKLVPDNLPASLGHAWCIDQSGQKQRAIAEYRNVIKVAWKEEKHLKSAGLGWHSVTAEAAGYLIPLLDTNNDKEEINALQNRIKQMEAVTRPITPIAIPLRDGVTATRIEDRSASVAFDADGSGLLKRWTWITRDAGWLVNDPHHTGKITSALQLFGNVTFWMFWNNGYDPLTALDDDRDGMLAGKELDGLAIWRDLNHNGVSERGEVKPLAEWGVVAISCSYFKDVTHPDQIAYSPRGVFYRDGSNRPTYDIILHPAIPTVE